MKYIVFALILVVLFFLGNALYHMLGMRGDGVKMAKALTWRIGICLFIFVLLIVAYLMGWLHPHPLILVVPDKS